MSFQIVLLAAFVAAASAGLAPLVGVAPAAVIEHVEHVEPAVVTKTVVENAPANYDYGYSVSDPLTGDHKSAQESRRGDVVQGRYSLIDADGTKRTVDYTADDVNGFNAVVSKEPLVQSVAVAADPVVEVKSVVAEPIVAEPVVEVKSVAQPIVAHHAPIVQTYSAPIVAAPVARYAVTPGAVSSSYHSQTHGGAIVKTIQEVAPVVKSYSVATPVAYSAPAAISTSYQSQHVAAPLVKSVVAPVATYAAYAAPVAKLAYAAPAVSYAAPAVAYSAPAAVSHSYQTQEVSAPLVKSVYAATPVAQYAAPVAQYAAPIVAKYAAPAVSSSYSTQSQTVSHHNLVAPVISAYSAPVHTYAHGAPVFAYHH